MITELSNKELIRAITIGVFCFVFQVYAFKDPAQPWWVYGLIGCTLSKLYSGIFLQRTR